MKKIIVFSFFIFLLTMNVYAADDFNSMTPEEKFNYNYSNFKYRIQYSYKYKFGTDEEENRDYIIVPNFDLKKVVKICNYSRINYDDGIVRPTDYIVLYEDGTISDKVYGFVFKLPSGGYTVMSSLGSMGKYDSHATLSSNIPLFEEKADAYAYIKGEVGLEKAINATDCVPIDYDLEVPKGLNFQPNVENLIDITSFSLTMDKVENQNERDLKVEYDIYMQLATRNYHWYDGALTFLFDTVNYTALSDKPLYYGRSTFKARARAGLDRFGTTVFEKSQWDEYCKINFTNYQECYPLKVQCNVRFVEVIDGEVHVSNWVSCSWEEGKGSTYQEYVEPEDYDPTNPSDIHRGDKIDDGEYSGGGGGHSFEFDGKNQFGFSSLFNFFKQVFKMLPEDWWTMLTVGFALIVALMIKRAIL